MKKSRFTEEQIAFVRRERACLDAWTAQTALKPIVLGIGLRQNCRIARGGRSPRTEP